MISPTAAIALPQGFTSVDADTPEENRPVLAIRLASYKGSRFELLTAKYMPTYRPLSPWRTVCQDAVSETGSEILGWAYVDDWLQ